MRLEKRTYLPHFFLPYPPKSVPTYPPKQAPEISMSRKRSISWVTNSKKKKKTYLRTPKKTTLKKKKRTYVPPKNRPRLGRSLWSAKTKTKTGCFSFSFSRNGPYGTKTGADEFAAAEKWSRQLVLTLTKTNTNLVRTFLVFSERPKMGGRVGIADYLGDGYAPLGHEIKPDFPS